MDVQRFIGRGSKLVPKLKHHDIKEIIEIVGEYGVWPQLELASALTTKAQEMFDMALGDDGHVTMTPSYPGFSDNDAFSYSLGFTWPTVLLEAAIIRCLGKDVNRYSTIQVTDTGPWNIARSHHIETVKSMLRGNPNGTGIYTYARQNPPHEVKNSTLLGFHVGMAAAEIAYSSYIVNVKSAVAINFGEEALINYFHDV